MEIGLEFSDTSPYSISEYVGEVGKTATAGQNVAFSDFYGLSSGINVTVTIGTYVDTQQKLGDVNYRGFCLQNRLILSPLGPSSTFGSRTPTTVNGVTVSTISQSYNVGTELYFTQIGFLGDVTSAPPWDNVVFNGQPYSRGEDAGFYNSTLGATTWSFGDTAWRINASGNFSAVFS